MTDNNPLRFCDSCGQVDDHPRHAFVASPGDGASNPELIREAVKRAKSDEEIFAIIAASNDDGFITKHMDCCEADGCPDGTCTVVRAGAENKKGAELAKHLVKRGEQAATNQKD